MPEQVPGIIVVGSLNIDYIASVEHLPVPGETVPAQDLIQRFGGKGANQAVAAARQGAKVSMIGCVGADDNGRAYRRRLVAEGINVRGLFSTDQGLTGTALIAVDRSAENIIVVAPGANGHLRTSAIRKLSPMLHPWVTVLLQFEIPLETVIAVIRAANRASAPVVLNPSPFRDGFPWGECRVDTLIANENEAVAIFGRSVETVRAKPETWRKKLTEKRIERLVVTRGAKPTLYLGAETCVEVPGLRVRPVDTVGAGDAFAGTYVARRADGLDVESAIRYANCAAALATLKPGAQESMPSRAATDRAFRGEH
ncbi:MAG TPA: ribokinase [Verrucomicrobiae bacterium]